MKRLGSKVGEIALGVFGLIALASVLVSLPSILDYLNTANRWLHSHLSPLQAGAGAGLLIGVTLCVVWAETRKDSKIRQRVVGVATLGVVGGVAFLLSPFPHPVPISFGKPQKHDRAHEKGEGAEIALGGKGHHGHGKLTKAEVSATSEGESGTGLPAAEAASAGCGCASVKYKGPSTSGRHPTTYGEAPEPEFEEPEEEEPEPDLEEPEEEEPEIQFSQSHVSTSSSSASSAAAGEAQAEAATQRAEEIVAEAKSRSESYSGAWP
jgi:hypothetical protein